MSTMFDTVNTYIVQCKPDVPEGGASKPLTGDREWLETLMRCARLAVGGCSSPPCSRPCGLNTSSSYAFVCWRKPNRPFSFISGCRTLSDANWPPNCGGVQLSYFHKHKKWIIAFRKSHHRLIDPILNGCATNFNSTMSRKQVQCYYKCCYFFFGK